MLFCTLNYFCSRSWNLFIYIFFLYRLWIAKRRLLCFQRHHSPLFVLGMPNWGFLERFHLQGTCLGLGSMVSHLIQIQCFLRRPLSKFQNPIQNLRNLKSQDLFYSKYLRPFFHSRIQHPKVFQMPHFKNNNYIYFCVETGFSLT